MAVETVLSTCLHKGKPLKATRQALNGKIQVNLELQKKAPANESDY